MNWNYNNEYQNWNTTIANIEEKSILAKKVAMLVKDGETIGFGSGSTSFLAIKEIAKRIKDENLNIVAIPTSYEIKLLCSSLQIPTASILEKKPDWCFDGVDEIDNNGWMIKGRGAAMFKEKLNFLASNKVYILADISKFVEKLGTRFAIPVECYPETVSFVKEQLTKLGAKTCNLRPAQGKDGPVITENNNFILDVSFESINKDLEKNLKQITGVVETGLFIGYNNIEILN